MKKQPNEFTVDDFFASLPPEEVWRYVQDIRQQEDLDWNFLQYDRTEPFSVGRFILAFAYALTKEIGDSTISPELIKEIHRYALNGVQKTLKTLPGKMRAEGEKNTIDLIYTRSHGIDGKYEREQYLAWLKEMKEKNVPLAWWPGKEILEYAPTLTKEFDQWLKNICDEYNQKIKNAKNEDEKLAAQIDFLSTLDRFHVFKDGNIRTVYILLNGALIKNGSLPTLLYDPNDFDSFSRKLISREIAVGIDRTRELMVHCHDKGYKLFGHNSKEIFEKSEPHNDKVKSIVLLAGKWFCGLTQHVWKLYREGKDNKEIDVAKLEFTLEFLKNHDHGLLMELSFADDLFSEALRFYAKKEIQLSKGYLEAAIKLVFHSETPENIINKLVESCWKSIEKGAHDQKHYEVTSQWINLLYDDYKNILEEHFVSGAYKAVSKWINFFRLERDRVPYDELFSKQIQLAIGDSLTQKNIEKAFSDLAIAKAHFPQPTYLEIESFFISTGLNEAIALSKNWPRDFKKYITIAAEILYKKDISKKELDELIERVSKKILQRKTEAKIDLSIFYDCHIDMIMSQMSQGEIASVTAWLDRFDPRQAQHKRYEIFCEKVKNNLSAFLTEKKIKEAINYLDVAEQVVTKTSYEDKNYVIRNSIQVFSSPDDEYRGQINRFYAQIIDSQDEGFIQKTLHFYYPGDDRNKAREDFDSIIRICVRCKEYGLAELFINCIPNQGDKQFFAKIGEKLSYIQAINKEMERLSWTGLRLFSTPSTKIQVFQDLRAVIVGSLFNDEDTLSQIKETFSKQVSARQFTEGAKQTNAAILGTWSLLDDGTESLKILKSPHPL